MKKIAFIIAFLFICGCSQPTMKTPPWNIYDTHRHQAMNVDCVPVVEFVW